MRIYTRELLRVIKPTMASYQQQSPQNPAGIFSSDGLGQGQPEGEVLRCAHCLAGRVIF